MNVRGNVLFILLMTIALLGALTYTVTRTSGNVSGNRDAEMSYLAASEVIRYAARVASGLQRVQLVNKCTLREVSFDHPERENYNVNGHYLNPNAREGGTCHVFLSSGGNTPYKIPPDEAGFHGGIEYNISNNIDVYGLSTTNNQSDLVLNTFVSEEMCFQINRILGIDNPGGNPPVYSDTANFNVPASASHSFPDFSGGNVEGFNSPIMNLGAESAGQAPELRNKASGCFYASNSMNQYVFYSLLVAR